MNKWLYVLGVVLIAGFAALSVAEMARSRTAYVTSVSEVRARKDRPVQFMGSIVRGKTSYDDETDELLFRLADGKGSSLAVRYNGVKPANFDGAAKAVVRGTYNGAEFIADEILLKCPSKYRGK